ncbi:hypothetical protein [Paenibacillus mesotrionivorans]|uniref:Uncharacterized protein n=1 Tax=Paenibacillus mesotrionivorans TaxID=3160968 RepID=A0ACC7NZP2_9BACL
MKKRGVRGSFVVLISLLLLTIGFFIGKLTDGSLKELTQKMDKQQQYFALLKEVYIDEGWPPTPEVTVNDRLIDLKVGYVSWSNRGGAYTQDASDVLTMDLPAVIVPGGATIQIKPGKVNNHGAPIAGIKSLSLRYADGKKEKNIFQVPEQQGLYRYRIDVKWKLDQGNASFYFSLQVE